MNTKGVAPRTANPIAFDSSIAVARLLQYSRRARAIAVTADRTAAPPNVGDIVPRPIAIKAPVRSAADRAPRNSPRGGEDEASRIAAGAAPQRRAGRGAPRPNRHGPRGRRRPPPPQPPREGA